MRRRLFRTLFAVTGATAILLGTQSAAQAEPGSGVVASETIKQNTDSGFCWAEAQLLGNSYATALFMNAEAGWDCTMWLERSTNGGQSWYTISGYHTLKTSVTPYDGDSTYEYWDGSGYLARACFHLNFAGAAHHCTAGV